jgi:hypothetical protein
MSDMIEQLTDDKRHGALSSITLGEVMEQLKKDINDNNAQEELMNTIMDYLTSE